jgi:peptide/nickel transport system substrate-binding protein
MGSDSPQGTDHARLDVLRRDRDPLAEHVIDEFVDGRLSRRNFVMRAGMIGLSLPAVAGILSACGTGTTSAPAGTTGTAGGSGKAGATIKAGVIAPTHVPNPLTVEDLGGIAMLNQVGEGLVFYGNDNKPRPWLATSWKPNADATVWTFKLRKGVKFNDGTPMTADDVVYSYQEQCDPKNGGTALSLFAGLLVPSGVVKVDEGTVAFHLQEPNGAFPSAVSSSNFNAIVVPKGTDFTKWSSSFIGTGPFAMTNYSQTTGASFKQNPHYWGKVLPAALEITFYPEEQPMVAALQSGSLDCISQFTVATSPQLLTGNYNVITTKGSANRQLSMRCDIPPFDNKYARQAVALTLDRPAIIEALFKGNADLGNDNPFAPAFPMTDTSIPQREENLKEAKELLAKAGSPRGFSTKLYTEQLQEMPQFAQIVKASAAKIGVDITLNVETIAGYYGEGTFGKADWLDGEMSLVDYGARPVPNLFLQAPLQTTDAKTEQGSWNAAHFSNPEYDALSKQYLAATDLQTQTKLAGEIQTLLLDETPIIFPYFYDHLSASQSNVYGVEAQASQNFYLNNVTKS